MSFMKLKDLCSQGKRGLKYLIVQICWRIMNSSLYHLCRSGNQVEGNPGAASGDETV